jgi:hypothetical protein
VDAQGFEAAPAAGLVEAASHRVADIVEAGSVAVDGDMLRIKQTCIIFCFSSLSFLTTACSAIRGGNRVTELDFHFLKSNKRSWDYGFVSFFLFLLPSSLAFSFFVCMIGGYDTLRELGAKNRAEG